MDPSDLQDLDGWQALGCAILARAFEDAHQARGHRDARAAGYPPGVSLADGARHFLDGDGARQLWALLGLDPAELDRRLAMLPRATCIQPALFCFEEPWADRKRGRPRRTPAAPTPTRPGPIPGPVTSPLEEWRRRASVGYLARMVQADIFAPVGSR